MCKKTFKRHYNLKMHREKLACRMLNQPKKKKFPCSDCCKSFNSRSNLSEHKRIHRNEDKDEDSSAASSNSISAPPSASLSMIQQIPQALNPSSTQILPQSESQVKIPQNLDAEPQLHGSTGQCSSLSSTSSFENVHQSESPTTNYQVFTSSNILINRILM